LHGSFPQDHDDQLDGASFPLPEPSEKKSKRSVAGMRGRIVARQRLGSIVSVPRDALQQPTLEQVAAMVGCPLDMQFAELPDDLQDEYRRTIKV